MKYVLIIFVSALLLVCIAPLSLQASDGVSNAVVKVFTMSNKYDYSEPWQMSGQRHGAGSGVIISGNRILTNAHVVSDSVFIQVKRSGQAKKYTATVEFIAHDCDLAILKVSDEVFYKGAKPIEVGELPRMKDKIGVYGFPTGGEELSITEGVVSRVDKMTYVHSGENLLAFQIDAAINPGNSGGPVIKNNKIVGIAFQGMRGNSIGYMIPTPIINRFLNDIKDGSYDGIPGLGMNIQLMENDLLRSHYGLSSEQSGVLVTGLSAKGPVEGAIKVGDVILSIDGTSIDNDGKYAFREDERILFTHLHQMKMMNEKIKFKFLRENKVMEIDVTLEKTFNDTRLVSNTIYGKPPTYYIYGGIVFTPLTLNLLEDLWGDKWSERAPAALQNYYFNGIPTKDRQEIVVLLEVLPDEINVGYHDGSSEIVTEVNSSKISSMRDLIKAIENNRGDNTVIKIADGEIAVFNRQKTAQAEQRILTKFGVNSNRSHDLMQ